MGLPELRPPYWYLAFFSDGFKIWKKNLKKKIFKILTLTLPGISWFNNLHGHLKSVHLTLHPPWGKVSSLQVLLFGKRSGSRMREVMTYLERTHQGLIDRHHSTSVVKLSTIVWSWKERHQLSFCKKLVSIFHNLMGQREVLLKVSKQQFSSFWRFLKQ